MSHVTAAPNVLAASAGELAAIGSTMRAANAAAAAPTAGVLAAGGDDVSAGIAALFGARAQAYQAISAQAALFHDRFVQILQEGAAAYAMAEAANALPLQKAQGVVSELAQDRTGGTGTGQSRGAGVSPATTSAVAAESGSTPATKAQAMHATTNPGNAAHQGNPADPGNSARRADGGRDEQLLLLPLTSLRGLRHTLKKLSGLRARNGLLTASGDNASGSGRPWDRDQLLRALGLRPPGHE